MSGAAKTCRSKISKKGYPRQRACKRRFKLYGGPLDATHIMLSTPGTLTIRLRGQVGHYDANCRWVPHEAIGVLPL